jgi:PEP-CTERM motif
MSTGGPLSSRFSIGAVVVGTGLLLAPAQARAETIDFVDVAHASIVEVAGPNGGPSYRVWAGELKWNWEGGVPAGMVDPIYSYCVDIVSELTFSQDVAIASTNALSSSVATLAPDAGAKAAWLVNAFAETVRSASDDVANTLGAALQVAIWEAIYDNTNSLVGGSFRLISGGDIATQAETYLAQLYGANYMGSSATLLDTREGQDQIARVPEPATLLLIGIGVTALFTRSRRHVLA